jgi:TolA-binding protein
MKKSILLTMLALLAAAGFSPSSQAYERRDQDNVREQRRENRDSDLRQLRAELYQLNILFSRVDAHLRYGAGRQSRWIYSRLLRDRDRLNYELQRRPLDRPRLHAQIDRLRDELRELEVRIRLHPRRFYR